MLPGPIEIQEGVIVIATIFVQATKTQKERTAIFV